MKIFCAICFVICVVFSTAAQNSETLRKDESIASEFVARSGWRVPFFIGNTKVSPIRPLDLIEDVDIRARVNSFGQENFSILNSAGQRTICQPLKTTAKDIYSMIL